MAKLVRSWLWLRLLVTPMVMIVATNNPMFTAKVTSIWWMLHDSPDSSSTVHLPPSVCINNVWSTSAAYMRQNAAPSSLCWVAPEFLHPNPLQRVGRADLWNHHLHLRHLDTYSGVRAIRFLGSVSATTCVIVFFLVVLLIDQIVSFLVLRSSCSSSSWWTLVGLHCICLPASTELRDFEQLTVTRGNGATNALSMGPFAGYNFISEFVKFNLILLIISMFILHVLYNVVSSRVSHMHIYVITNMLLFFWIKFNMKMSKLLTLITRGHKVGRSVDPSESKKVRSTWTLVKTEFGTN